MNKLEEMNIKIAKTEALKKKKRKKARSSYTARNKKKWPKLNVATMVNDWIKMSVGQGLDHDYTVGTILKKNGFLEIYKDDLRDWIEDQTGKKHTVVGREWQDKLIFWEKGVYPFERHFISQPNGSQNKPDYYIFINGALIPFDAKSHKDGSAKWNSSFPLDYGLYLISKKDERNPKSVLVFGKYLIDKAVVEMYKKYDKKYDTFVAHINADLRKIQPGRNTKTFLKFWQVYARKDYTNATRFALLGNTGPIKKEIIEKIKGLLSE